ncbi:MAG: Flp pilus assembly protein CpaB [Algiphilus sp.]|uniref:Flp pilus assembly protein CpaB n=1 Tax=Algiphilus sp. TaxID=1872431 RepID=UPI0032EFEF4D
MSSTALKIAAVVTVLLAVILAVVAFQMTRSYTAAPTAPDASAAAGDAAAAKEKESFPQAVVAVAPLAAYQPIQAEQVRIAPVAVKTEGQFDSVEDVVNRIPLVDVDAGAPVTGRHFKDANELARIVPEGHKAMSLEVNDVIAVGGFLRPGDIVDILVYLRGGADIEAVQARILLREIRVLALEDRIVDRPEGVADDKEEDRRRRQRTVVLAVPDDKTTRLMLGSNLGEIRLAMHGQVPEVAQLDALSDEALLEAGGSTVKPDSQSKQVAADAAQAKADEGETDLPLTAAQLSSVEAPKNKQAQQSREPRHRIYVYRGADVETVYD